MSTSIDEIHATSSRPPVASATEPVTLGGTARILEAGDDLRNLRRRLTARVLQELESRRTVPTSTYRLQFHGGFGFAEATKITPYLQALGISHVYASPLLQARPGSAHGYDVCDHQRLDDELGGDAGFAAWSESLAQHELGLILDIVPNHMSTHAMNRWWTDVLESGPSSPYARYFDLDWLPVRSELHNRVLLPVLGGQYGAVLEAGELQIEYRDGAFFVRYFERLFPLDPKSTARILADRLGELRAMLADHTAQLAEYESLLTALDHLPPTTATKPEESIERQRDKEIIKRRLRDLTADCPLINAFLADNLVRLNGTSAEPASFDQLDALLAAQPYRLCHWKAAGDEVNYRRFFDINELAALCTEDPEVFFHTHRLVLKLLAEGKVAGLRIDHIDGLYAPEQYLWRLQWAYLAELVRRALAEEKSSTSADVAQNVDGTGHNDLPAAGGDDSLDVAPLVVADLCRRLDLPLPGQEDWLAVLGSAPRMLPVPIEEQPPVEPVRALELPRPPVPLYVLVEKILGPHEALPESWPVAGTTGYDFLHMCDGLFLPADGVRQVTRDYQRLTGRTESFEEVARDSKLLILRVAMAGELQMLAHRLSHLAEQHRRSRDFTLNMLRYALREILVFFPVYRIYPGPAGVSDRDRRFVAQAVAQATRRNPATDAGVFDFIRDVLLGEHPAGLTAAQKQLRELFAGRFQQVTSPIMAKGVEDTAFYAYCPLLSINEVGTGPESPVVEPAAFHDWNEHRAAASPHTMLASSTHDTKRSEDVRARLHLIAEIPRAWRAAAQRWARLNRRRRREVDGLPAPDRGDEQLFYQSMLGIWPAQAIGAAEREVLAERLRRYMDKAGHEAKQRTSWINPNEPYDRAVADFVTSALADRADNKFLTDFLHWLPPVAHLGMVNALAELVLKLTCPGVPDIYQGQECWQFRLVDPDNRGAVDFALRAELLNELRSSTADDHCGQLARELAANLASPHTKLFVTWRLLRLRAQLRELFTGGKYLRLTPLGARAEHCLAFARLRPSANEQRVMVVVPRLVARLLRLDPAAPQQPGFPAGVEIWEDTRIKIPPDLSGSLVDVFTGQRHAATGELSLAALFADFPVAVLAG